MYGSKRYRYNAAEYLRAAQVARDQFHRKVHLSMALSWLSLAREDEAASTPTISCADVPLPISRKSDRFAAYLNGLSRRTEARWPYKPADLSGAV